MVPINKRLKEGYKIREHKTLGIYVEGLSKHYVDTYESIEAKMEEAAEEGTRIGLTGADLHAMLDLFLLEENNGTNS